MKTETQMAKENVEKSRKFQKQKLYLDKDVKDIYTLRGRAKEHLASCQRFLGFLESKPDKAWKFYDNLSNPHYKIMKNKIKDLQNAIKIYKEAGLK